MSPKSTSSMSPSDTRWENPKPRGSAQSCTAVTIAPDWATKARLPDAELRCEKLAFKRNVGERMPRQLGPMMRVPCGCVAWSKAWARGSPSSARVPSPKPAVMTTTALVPCSPRERTSPGIEAGGVARTASSGASGRASTDGTLWTPRMTSPRGFTNDSAGPKPPACRFLAMTFPTEPGRALAPTSATERGRKNDFMFLMLKASFIS